MNPGSPFASATRGDEHTLRRQLSERQLTMIAIGGAIGVGLFLGSSTAIALAGPAIILSYLGAAVVALILAYAAAEMALLEPVAGSFGLCAERYVSRWCGFAVRATYSIIQIIAIGAEVTAIAIYFRYWFPASPQWIWVAIGSCLLVAINALQVGYLGEFEYWFALIKVLAIVLFILAGIALILGGRPALGLRNIIAYGGFFPHGFAGAWLALTLALPSYMGVEIVAVAAGEAEHPEQTIPQAMRAIVFRLILFYVLAMAMMVTMAPWSETSARDLAGSPFVRAFRAIGIPYAPWVMNLVVITAAFSSANTNLYLSSRMLFSLAQRHYAAQALSRLSRRGVPLGALALSSIGMVVAIVLAAYMPERAFLVLFGSAVAGMYFVWIVILLAHMGFRRARPRQAELRDLPLRLRMSPLSNILGILLLLSIAGTSFYVKGLQYSVPVFLVLLSAISLAYWGCPGIPAAASRDTELAGKSSRADESQAGAGVGSAKFKR
jgi:L-asparagine transporter-like permease